MAATRRQECAGARTVYLIVDSRLPNQVDYWPAFQPSWTSREQIFGPHKEVTRLVWYHVNAESGVQHVPHIWAGVFALLVAPVPVSNHSYCIGGHRLCASLTLQYSSWRSLRNAPAHA